MKNHTPTWAENLLQKFDDKYPNLVSTIHHEYEDAWALHPASIKNFLLAALQDLEGQLSGMKKVCLLPHSLEEQKNSLPYCEHIRTHNATLDAAIALIRLTHDEK